ncbi:MAG: hypothetical protein HYY34_03310 [Chloroflexi bacterium]|nr:hypothetical protein [Chloroflexota bacterium]
MSGGSIGFQFQPSLPKSPAHTSIFESLRAAGIISDCKNATFACPVCSAANLVRVSEMVRTMTKSANG